MNDFGVQLAVFALFITLLGVGLYGVRTPRHASVMPVETMQLAAHANGLAVTQGHRNTYYTFSPLNDYFITEKGRESFITQKDMKNNPYKTSLDSFKAAQIGETVQGYFQYIAPSVTFYSKRKVTYTSTVSGNTVAVKSTVTAEGSTPRIISATMTWKVPDVIFDKTGRLYNYVGPEDREFFRETLGITLNQDELGELRVPVPQNAVAIINPKVAGAIVVRASKTQRLFVDRSWRFVEVQQAANEENGTYHADIRIEIYPTAREAINAL